MDSLRETSFKGLSESYIFGFLSIMLNICLPRILAEINACMLGKAESKVIKPVMRAI
jgi:hypothetical protein